MNSNSVKYLTLVIVAASSIISGCAGVHYNEGKTARSSEVLPLVSGAATPMVWQTNDLSVKYQVEGNEDNRVISGELSLKDNIRYLFPKIRFFYFYINYLDASGRVVSSHDISPVMAPSIDYRSAFAFRAPPPVPRDAIALVFNYWGIFREEGFSGGGSSLGGGSEWEIYYNPFE